MSETVNLRFIPTQEDYVQSTRSYLWHNRRFRRIFFIQALLFLCMIGVFILLNLYPPSELSLYIVLAVIIIQFPLFAIFFFWALPLLTGRRFRKNERMHSETFWELNDDRVIIKNKFVETKTDWGSFKAVIEIKNHYLFMATAFIFLPKRVFESPEQETAFRNLVSRNVKRVELLRS
jgi:YcxB-like protein